MKTNFQNVLLAVIAVTSVTALAKPKPQTLELQGAVIRARITKITGAECKQDPFVENVSPTDLDSAVDDVARRIGAWNPEIGARLAKSVLKKRVAQKGVRKGLIEPALLLMDLAILSNRPDVPQLLVPAIARVFPSVALKIKSSLAIPELDANNWYNSLRALHRDTLITLGDEGLSRNVPHSQMGPLVNYDPSGVGDIVMGHGSMIWGQFRNNEIDRRDDEFSRKTNIFGISRADVESCYSSCEPAMEHGRQIGRRTGATVGPITAFGHANVDREPKVKTILESHRTSWKSFVRRPVVLSPLYFTAAVLIGLATLHMRCQPLCL